MKTSALKPHHADCNRGPGPAGRGTAAAQQPDNAEAQAAYADIKKTLGLVPSFLKAFPAEAIAAVWDEYKGTELNPTPPCPANTRS